MMKKQSLDFITDFLVGTTTNYQLPSHQLKRDILLIPKRAEKN